MRRFALRAAWVAALALAACGGKDEPKFDARAPDVPFMDQLNPAGKTAGYDGSEFCGPAVLAGIARGHGIGAGMTDAALITEMAALAGTDPGTGTTGNGIIQGLTALGLHNEAIPGADLDWIDDQLASNADVIAQGDYYDIPAHADPNRTNGHFIAISAVANNWTVYKVMDPASSAVTYLTDQQLVKFITDAPGGGFTIATW
jgi:hypothetical protein